MPWSTPNTYSNGQIMRASHFNQDLRDNFNYLNAERALGTAYFPRGTTNLTTTSSSTVVVPGTQFTINISSGRALALVLANISTSSASTAGALWLAMDGVLQAIALYTNSTTTSGLNQTLTPHLLTGLSNGNHTFDVRWRNDGGGTTTLSMEQSPFLLAVMEV